MYAIFINLCTVSSNVHVELYLFPWPTLTVIMAGPNCPTNWQSTSRNVTLVQILNHLSALEFLNFDIDTVWMSTQYLEKVPTSAFSLGAVHSVHTLLKHLYRLTQSRILLYKSIKMLT